jgi:integral membrane protein
MELVTTPVLWIAMTEVGEIVASMTPRAKLVRKARFTKAMAAVECASYLLLAVFMFRKYVMNNTSDANYVLLRVVAYFHGMICIAFGVMVLDIFRAMKWKGTFALLTLAGPPGAFIAHQRLRKQPVPEHVSQKDMLF